MNKTFYITTPIYYPSGRFHIGTAYCEVLTESIKKYKESRGYDSFMLTGLDEHGQKIEEVAKKRGLTPKEHVDQIANDVIKLWDLMDIKYDKFIRTTDDYHVKSVTNIVQKYLDNGDIYKGTYEGWYCMSDENYFTETQLVDGKCPDCGREVKLMREEAYFFNMKKYENWLKDFYKENPDFLVPESRKNEIFKNFIEPGLEDLCISRNTFDWGIKMPNDPEHVLYVWLDALTNYITALGYGSNDESLFNKYWPADLHVVGKEIIRFHGIYWPIFLHALNLPLPKKIYAHSWIVMKDGKMSKSVGNVIYPEDLIKRYGLDATKYFLLRMMTFDKDSVFTPEDFVERYNSDLSNDLGNLLNRTVGMLNKYNNGVIKVDIKSTTEFDENFNNFIDNMIKEVENNMDNYHVTNALINIWSIISRANKYIDETAPWSLFKGDDLDKEKLNSVLYNIYPFMESTSKEIMNQLNLDDSNMKWDNLNNDIKEDTKVIEVGKPLFVRLDQEQEIEYIKGLMNNH